MKKFLAILLAVSLALMVFSACANNNNTSPSPTTGANASPSAPAGEDPSTQTSPTENNEPVTITLGIYPDDTNENLIKIEDEFIAKYKEKYTNVTVVPKYYKYATDNFVPMAQTKSTPTIFETWFTEPKKLVKAGYVRDITAILEERGWADLINPIAKPLLTGDDGKIYGIPRDGYGLGLYCSVEVFTEAGLVNDDGTLQYPKTWEELAETAKTIREKTGARGLCLLAGEDLSADGWHFSNIAWDFGAIDANALVKDNGDDTYTSNINNEKVIDAMNYVKSLKWDYDALSEDPTTEGWGTGFQKISSGVCGMYIGGNDAVDQFATNDLDPDGVFFAPLPAGPAGQFALWGGSVYMFPEFATDAEVNAALDYLVMRGRSPIMTDDAKESLRAGWKANKENGISVVPPLVSWESPDLQKATDDAIAEFRNVDTKMWPFYDKIYTMLRPEEKAGGQVQTMYSELGKVVQKVVTDKNADVKALLDAANANLQAILDNPDLA